MKLKTNIFLWVFLATAVPICAITLYATVYSERLYQQDVNREVTDSLSNIASEIRRRLLLDRDLLRGLSGVPPVQEFLPVLRQLVEGGVHPESSTRISRVEKFLVEFQVILSRTSRFRILDLHGNTLVPVNTGQEFNLLGGEILISTPNGTSSREGGFQELVRNLVPGEIGYILFPDRNIDPGTLEPAPLFDMVLALGEGDRPIGYLTARVRYEPIERLLNVSPRLHNGKFFIAEIDPENEERDGLTLYDDQSGVALSTERLWAGRFQERQPETYELVQRELFGFHDSPNGDVRTYYSEFLPYPNRLLIWVVGIQIDLDDLGAPFQRVRIAILIVGLLALFSSFLLARLGTRKIALPIMDLAGKLTDFSRGEHKLRVDIQGSDEIRQAGTAFNNMAASFKKTEEERDRAMTVMMQKEKLASVGQLAAGIGHEINNPLHNIITLTKLMDRSYSPADDELREDIQSVREEAQRACRIVRAVLNFSREVPLEYTSFELEPWLQEILSLIEQEAGRRRISLFYEGEGSYRLDGDPNLLEQVLINLLLNAMQASPPGAEVRVIVKEVDKTLVIDVHDQGEGIAPGDMEHVFDPFFTTKTAEGGSGLGLSISLGIIEQHGGELSLHNRPPRGVTASISLPLARETKHVDMITVCDTD
ncbi:MAG: HAMP domain-containing histidine kinase [Gammaproteobacteria bacterium]|nr:HAMP domain-containing histidine kinase [Gammaproteobacteria bacterium]